MSNYILAGLSFLAGGAISGVTAWLLAKKHYEKRLDAEINDIWREIDGALEDEGEPDTPVIKDRQEMPIPQPHTIMDKPDLNEYANKLRNEGYTAPDLPKTNDFIHEIGENDLDEELYQRIDLTLYADGLLADDQDYPIRSLSDTVGENFLQLMEGKDELFIRNEKRMIDYDICRSLLSYGEMLDRHPETEQRLQYDDALNDYYEDKDEEEEEDEE